MVTIGIIGCGQWGPNVARNFLSLDGARVDCICDADPVRLAAIRKTFRDIPASAVAAEVLSSPTVQAVAIATPAESHFALALAAIEKGKHVLVEKPIARTHAEAVRLTEAAKKAGVVLLVSHVFLYNSGIRAAKNLIRSGDLGRIRYLSSVRTNLGPIRRDVNAVWDLAPHDLSIFEYWLEKEPSRVTAKGASFLDPGREDVGFITLAYPEGVAAHVEVSWLAPRKVREITVVGEKKMLVFNDLNLVEPIRVFDKKVEKEAITGTFAEFQTLTRDGDILIPYVAMKEPLGELCRHFLECVEKGEKPLTGGESGARVVKVLEAIDRSMANGSEEVEIGPG